MVISNFSDLATSPARRLALQLVEDAIPAVSPARLLRQHLRVRGAALRVHGHQFSLRKRRVWVFGAGKASASMAAAVEELLDPQFELSGLLIAAPNTLGPAPQKVRVVPGDHPVPGPASEEATRELLQLAERVAPTDLVLWLISGGASAMLVAPAPGITLAEKQAVTQLLLRSGATIEEMNAVRKHLSAVKGGLLARRLAPAPILTLALSDVASGRLDTVGSGPTIPDPTTYSDALGVVDRYRLRTGVPASVLHHLEAGAASARPETPKLEDLCFAQNYTCVIGSPSTAAAAAARAARAAGMAHASVLTDQLTGEARTVAGLLGSVFRYQAQAHPKRLQVLVATGEVTVTVTGRGKGGRCQELAAALIPEIAGLPGCAVACAATDGRDFLEGVGGALVDGKTAAQARAAGLPVEDYLRANDSYALHQQLATLLEMAPTGTNVCDIIVCVLGLT